MVHQPPYLTSMFRRLTTIGLLTLFIPSLAFAQQVIRVTDADIQAGQTVHWTSDNTYVLDGIVFVEEGAQLFIEAGTVVKAESGQGNQASALVITRGAKIFAEGTADAPIIFTSIEDDIDDPTDLTYTDRGYWGGLVILGRATTNNPTAGGIKEIEGINEIVGEGDTRAEYGGTDDDDDSGVLRYVSIRHTGIQVGDQAGNEIQGLTLGAVGRGTTIEYVESYASADDGFEFFGGTVDTKYLVSAFNADDAFDYDEGFRGRGQFWFALQAPDAAGRAAEQDGAIGNEFFTPYAIPVIYNATYVGPGVGATAEGDGAEMLSFRDNAGGRYHNSIFTDFQTAEGGAALTIEDIDNTGAQTEDSRRRLEAGDLTLTHNLWWGFGDGNTVEAFAPQDFVQAYLAGATNYVEDPMLRGIDRGTSGAGGLDPRPADGSPAFTLARAALPDGDDFFEEVDYLGAFGTTNWLIGWTALAANGYVSTAIEQAEGAEVPSSVALDQNYPNPFNPTTTIAFTLDRTQHVRLSVYDVLGREVAVLVDGVQGAGAYRVPFDATGLVSGTYLYRLRAGSNTLSRTMLLVK